RGRGTGRPCHGTRGGAGGIARVDRTIDLTTGESRLTVGCQSERVPPGGPVADRSERPGASGETSRAMPHIITEPCIGTKDTACVDVCPVDCIYGKNEDWEMLYIHPE